MDATGGLHTHIRTDRLTHRPHLVDIATTRVADSGLDEVGATLFDKRGGSPNFITRERGGFDDALQRLVADCLLDGSDVLDDALSVVVGEGGPIHDHIHFISVIRERFHLDLFGPGVLYAVGEPDYDCDVGYVADEFRREFRMIGDHDGRTEPVLPNLLTEPSDVRLGRVRFDVRVVDDRRDGAWMGSQLLGLHVHGTVVLSPMPSVFPGSSVCAKEHRIRNAMQAWPRCESFITTECNHPVMDRRTFVKTAGAGAVVALAGCSAEQTDDPTPTDTDVSGTTPQPTQEQTPTTTPRPSGTLRIATYDSFTGEGTAGNYLKDAFESQYPDVTIEFTTPENGVNRYIQRKQQDAGIDVDLYVGLNTGELVRADEELDTSLFAPTRDDLERSDAVNPELEIDPQGRAVPYDTGYISLVYDEDAVDAPDTFDDLLGPAYEDALITQNAQQSDPGRAFLLWTIDAKGEDGYLDYWRDLVDNGVRILDDWQPAYNAYLNEEAPMVVSYSTDQVYYHGEDVDMSRHQVGFINDQGYANPETMARFADSDDLDLGRRFMDFVLQPEHQAEIAVRNVQFPAVTDAELSEEFSQYAYEPTEAVTFTYDRLQGNVETWIDDWARLVAGS